MNSTRLTDAQLLAILEKRVIEGPPLTVPEQFVLLALRSGWIDEEDAAEGDESARGTGESYAE